MPRRAHDSGRVRKAIRTELEESPRQARIRRPSPGQSRDASHRTRSFLWENISLSFEEQILDNISFKAYEGETIVVVGESGTGKSTILKLLLRLLVPDNGRVAIDGEDITHLTSTMRSRCDRRWEWCFRARRCSTR